MAIRKAIMAARTQCVPGGWGSTISLPQQSFVQRSFVQRSFAHQSSAQLIVGPILQALAAGYMLKRA